MISMKKVLFVTNLFPRPDVPRCGVFNAYFAGAMHRFDNAVVEVLVPVPEWKFWKHDCIRHWNKPDEISDLFSSVIKVHYIPVFYIPVIGRSFSWMFYRSAFLRCRKFFDRCDVVLGSWLYPDCVAAGAVAAACGKPFFARLHGTDRFHLDAAFRGAVCKRTLDMAKCIFVNAGFMSDALQRRAITKDKICVVRNGVDRNLFHPRKPSEIGVLSADFSHLFSEKTCVFLWVGNLVDIKAPDVAVKAFAAMMTACVPQSEKDEGIGNTAEFRLVIVGAGPLLRNLKLLAVDLGVEDYVIFCGSIPHRDIALWMNSADCLLLTSSSEGMPNVVIEALASGIPVVSTDVGDISCVIKNDSNGSIVKNSDTLVSDIANTMRKTAEQSWNSDNICVSVADFDWEKSAGAVLREISE